MIMLTRSTERIFNPVLIILVMIITSMSRAICLGWRGTMWGRESIMHAELATSVPLWIKPNLGCTHTFLEDTIAGFIRSGKVRNSQELGVAKSGITTSLLKVRNIQENGCQSQQKSQDFCLFCNMEFDIGQK